MRGRRPLILSIITMTTLAGLGACASRPALEARMQPIHLPGQPEEPPLLTENHFKRDVMGELDEAELREILISPVYLEEAARIGIVPVETGYAVDRDVPVVGVPGALAQELSDSGHFEVVSEVTTDWPTASNIAGLRELAARYRAEYLLLYRHRFVDRSWTNGWGVMWLTVIGGFILPTRTMEIAGVVEATMFDVKTGTLLFTTFERAHAKSDENIWQNDRKRRDIKTELLVKATRGLGEKVLEQVRRLVAARPERAPRTEVGRASGATTAPAPASPPAQQR